MTKTVDHIISQTREILIEGWITVNGARILIDDDTGEVEGGPKGLRGKVFKDAESKPLDQLQAEKDPHAGRVRVDKAPGDRLGGALYRHTLNVEKWTQRGDKEETIKAHRSAARAFRKEAESERRKGFEKDAKDLERAALYHERMEARFKAEAEGKEPKGPEPTKPEIVKQVEQEAKAEVPQPSTSRPIADLATPIGSTELEKSAARILQAHKANQEADKLANDDYASRRQSPGETFNQTLAARKESERLAYMQRQSLPPGTLERLVDKSNREADKPAQNSQPLISHIRSSNHVYGNELQISRNADAASQKALTSNRAEDHIAAAKAHDRPGQVENSSSFRDYHEKAAQLHREAARALDLKASEADDKRRAVEAEDRRYKAMGYVGGKKEYEDRKASGKEPHLSSTAPVAGSEERKLELIRQHGRQDGILHWAKERDELISKADSEVSRSHEVEHSNKAKITPASKAPGELKREDIISKAKVKAAPEGSNKQPVTVDGKVVGHLEKYEDRVAIRSAGSRIASGYSTQTRYRMYDAEGKPIGGRYGEPKRQYAIEALADHHVKSTKNVS